MDLEGIMLSDISPTNAIYNFIYMYNLKKNTQVNKQNKTEADPQIQRTKVSREEGVGDEKNE